MTTLLSAFLLLWSLVVFNVALSEAGRLLGMLSIPTEIPREDPTLWLEARQFPEGSRVGYLMSDHARTAEVAVREGSVVLLGWLGWPEPVFGEQRVPLEAVEHLWIEITDLGERSRPDLLTLGIQTPEGQRMLPALHLSQGDLERLVERIERARDEPDLHVPEPVELPDQPVTFEQLGAAQWVSRGVILAGVAFVVAFASVSSGGLSEDWLIGLAVPGFLLWVFGLLLSLRPATASVTVEADQVVVEGWVGDLVPRPSRITLPLRGLRVGWSRLGSRSANEEVLKLTPAEGAPLVLTGLKGGGRPSQIADAVYAAERAAERQEAGEPEPAPGIRPPSRIPEGS